MRVQIAEHETAAMEVEDKAVRSTVSWLVKAHRDSSVPARYQQVPAVHLKIPTRSLRPQRVRGLPQLADGRGLLGNTRHICDAFQINADVLVDWHPGHVNSRASRDIFVTVAPAHNPDNYREDRNTGPPVTRVQS